MRSALLLLLLFGLSPALSRGQTQSHVPREDVIRETGSEAPPGLSVLWDELLGLKELVLNLKAAEVGRRQTLRSVESRLRDREVEAEQQRGVLEGLAQVEAQVLVLQSRMSSSENSVEELKEKNSALAAELPFLQTRLRWSESTAEHMRRKSAVLAARLCSAESLMEELMEQTSAFLVSNSSSSETSELQEQLNIRLEELNTSSHAHGAELSAIALRLNITEEQLDTLRTRNTDGRTAAETATEGLQVRLGAAEAAIAQLETDTQAQSFLLTEVVSRTEAAESRGSVLQARLNRTDAVLKTHLEETEVRLRASEEQLEHLRTENTVFRFRLDETEKLTDDSGKLKVAFSAGLTDSGSVGPFDEERTLIFTKAISNVGQAYNQTTGVFTAPARGLYFFSFTAADFLKGYMGIYLYRNNQPILFNLDLNDHGGYASMSNGVALQLEEGDEVRLSLPASYRLYDDSRNFSVFSGFLLFAL